MNCNHGFPVSYWTSRDNDLQIAFVPECSECYETAQVQFGSGDDGIDECCSVIWTGNWDAIVLLSGTRLQTEANLGDEIIIKKN